MHPSRNTVPKTTSAATARIRKERLGIATARMVPRTSAIIVARVNAAAPTTAITEVRTFRITTRLRGSHSQGSHRMGATTHDGLQWRPDQSSATRIELLGCD